MCESQHCPLLEVYTFFVLINFYFRRRDYKIDLWNHKLSGGQGWSNIQHTTTSLFQKVKECNKKLVKFYYGTQNMLSYSYGMFWESFLVCINILVQSAQIKLW